MNVEWNVIGGRVCLYQCAVIWLAVVLRAFIGHPEGAWRAWSPGLHGVTGVLPSGAVHAADRTTADTALLHHAGWVWLNSQSYTSILLILFLVCLWTCIISLIIISRGENTNLLLSEYWFSEHSNSMWNGI